MIASSLAGPKSRMEKNGGILANVVLSLLLALLGWAAVQWRELIWPQRGDQKIDWTEMGLDPLQQLSFDVPFVVRYWLPVQLGPRRIHDKVVLLYMDEESTRALHQSPTGPWSRANHAQLLDKLTKDQARVVVFDVVFDSESDDDTRFETAIAGNERTFLGATFSASNDVPLTRDDVERRGRLGLAAEKLTYRNPRLYRAARGWGLLNFRPVDGDYGVRRLFVGKPREGFPAWPSISWQVARYLGADLSEDNGERFRPRWLNYYGPARQLTSVSYFRALLPDNDLPAGYFKDKIVIIGAHTQLTTGLQRPLEEFSTPWSRFGGRTYTPGAEIHATALLNLLHRDWLERVPLSLEKLLVLLIGISLGSLRWLRPWTAIVVAVLLTFCVFAISCILQWHAHVWWNWAVPVLVQIPLGVVLAVASRYYLEEARKRKLRNAFGFYLSPDLADEIAERNFPLAPGGEKVVATMVFTDIEGFTNLSEKLGDSALLAKVLTDYFTLTTHEILAQKGTVIKFIGDAVFAAWGAPLPQADHAERAVRAAWRVAQVSEMDVPIPKPDGTTATVHVRTRIGIHTGEALAGNLGSARRFDYTLIGDAVNFASRLEGANKYTGTTILLSDDTAQQLGGKFLIRRLGAFIVKGKAKAVAIHELLGNDPAARQPWLGQFDAALAAWTRGDFATARTGFEAVKAARQGTDGPSQFYLDRLDGAHLSPGWTGEVELEGK